MTRARDPRFDDARNLREEYRRLAAQRPLYAPHADVCFETLETLGKGGMGTVMRVRDRRLGREAALKILHKNDKPRARQRFSREARVTARLAHPSIPPVYEAGETAEGQLYLLMKVIEGETLDTLIRKAHRKKKQRAKRKRELIEALVKVCEALAYAHSQGVIHRDLKPENLMVGRFGEVMVMDWGIARDLSESSQSDIRFQADHGAVQLNELQTLATTLTQGGAIVGTLGYMAPEQARGEEVGPRSDVFALGVILTEILTGESAVPGDSATQKFVATVEGRLRFPRELEASVSRELDFIARRCLALEPDERWGCPELLVALKAWLNGERIAGCRYGPIDRGLRFVRRRPGLTASLSLGLLLALSSALFLLQLRSLDQQRRLAESESQRRGAALARSRVAEEAARSEARRAERVLELFNAARDLARRGAPEADLTAALERALEEGRREERALLTAAEVCDKAGFAAGQRRYLEEAVKRFPPGYEALLYLHFLETEGKLDIDSRFRREIIRLADERQDENEFVLCFRGNTLYLEKDYAGALACANKAEEYSQSLWTIYAMRAHCLQKLGRFDEALRDYERAFAIEPELPTAYNVRAELFMARGEPKRALADYDRAVELKPDFAEAIGNRATVQAGLGKVKEALRDLKRAEELEPRNPTYRLNRGLLYNRLKRYREAIAELDRAIALKPDYAAAYDSRGRAYEALGDRDRAFQEFSRAIEAKPRYAGAYLNRSRLLSFAGKLDQALIDINKALSFDPEYAAAYNNRAIIHMRLGKPREALKDYDAALKRDRKTPILYNNRGRLRFELGDSEGALEDYARALEINPRFGLAYKNRGQLYAGRGDREAAIADLRKALRFPTNPESAREARESLKRLGASER